MGAQNMDKHITTPITAEVTKNLKSGDYVYITGTIYVARDAAHKRMIEALERGENLPIDIKDSTIYYMGPSPAREGRPIGSAGPTTATRMDKYAPTLLDLGEKAMIGKGKRSKEVMDAIVRNHAVYFAAVGGAGFPAGHQPAGLLLPGRPGCGAGPGEGGRALPPGGGKALHTRRVRPGIVLRERQRRSRGPGEGGGVLHPGR